MEDCVLLDCVLAGLRPSESEIVRTAEETWNESSLA